MKIAVTGVTGQLGRLIVEDLKKRIPAEEIIGLARSPEKAEDLGIALRPADYARPETLKSALEGVDKLLLISSSEVGQRIVQHQNVINAAKAAQVKHIIYTSLLHADTSALDMLATEHLATEKMIRETGIPYTILRNGWYTENYMMGIPAAIEHGVLIGSAGQGRISSAPRSDYAEAAAIVLTQGEHIGKTYELAGDQAYTLTDLAKEISRQTGKDIPYQDLPPADYTDTLKKAGMPDAWAELLPALDVGASQGGLYSERKDLSQILERPTTTLAAYLKDALTKSAI